MKALGLGISQIKGEPLYSMTEAAKLLGSSTQTLICYRKHGLVFPVQNGRRPLFSANDVKWLRCVRELIHVNKFSIEALKKLLEYAPCWEIKNCTSEQRASHVELQNVTVSRMPGVTPDTGLSQEIIAGELLATPARERLCFPRKKKSTVVSAKHGNSLAEPGCRVSIK